MLHSKRNAHNGKPRYCNEEQPPSPQLEKARLQQQRLGTTNERFFKILEGMTHVCPKAITVFPHAWHKGQLDDYVKIRKHKDEGLH